MGVEPVAAGVDRPAVAEGGVPGVRIGSGVCAVPGRGVGRRADRRAPEAEGRQGAEQEPTATESWHVDDYGMTKP